MLSREGERQPVVGRTSLDVFSPVREGRTLSAHGDRWLEGALRLVVLTLLNGSSSRLSLWGQFPAEDPPGDAAGGPRRPLLQSAVGLPDPSHQGGGASGRRDGRDARPQKGSDLQPRCIAAPVGPITSSASVIGR